MASLNKVQLIGRLGKDPEIRTMGSGDKVASFSLAMTEKWTDKRSGEKKEKTEWANVSVWGDGLVGVVDRFVKKGDLIYVEGKFSTRKWKDKDGQDRYSTEVVIQGIGGALTMLGSKNDSGGGSRGGDDRGGDSGSSRYSSGGGTSNSSSNRDSFPADLDDEIPF